MANGFQLNVRGLGYFGVGAAAGFLGAGIGSGLTAGLPANAEAIDRSFGGDLTQEQIREMIRPGSNPELQALQDNVFWEQFRQTTGRDMGKYYSPNDFNINPIRSAMESGKRISLTLPPVNGNIGHSVVVKNITLKTITKTSGKVIQKYYLEVMNPARGGFFQKLDASELNNVNVFSIFSR